MRELVLTTVADIQPAPVRWLWKGYVPLGKVTVLAGPQGLGKSLLAARLAAQVSQRVSDVLIASAEDDPTDTITPRLIAAGADCRRVHLMDMRDTTDAGV